MIKRHSYSTTKQLPLNVLSNMSNLLLAFNCRLLLSSRHLVLLLLLLLSSSDLSAVVAIPIAAPQTPMLSVLSERYFATPNMNPNEQWISVEFQALQEFERRLLLQSSDAHSNDALDGGELPEMEPNDFGITFAQFEKASTANGYPSPSYAIYKYLVTHSPKTGAIATKQEFAMFLTHVLHESGGFQFVSEIGCPEQPKCRAYQFPAWNPNVCGPTKNRPCRQQPANRESTLYYGRGFMMLTWPVNYEAASWALFGDDRLYKDPNLISTNPAIALDTAMWFWQVAIRPQGRVQQGISPSVGTVFAHLYLGSFGASTMAMSGYLECQLGGPIFSAAKSRYQKYVRVFEALEVPGSPVENGCYN